MSALPKEPKQGDGTHLPVGSIGKAINSLRAELFAAKLNIQAAEAALAAEQKRSRDLEAALRSLAGATSKALAALE